jgi:hypothetical protein
MGVVAAALAACRGGMVAGECQDTDSSTSLFLAALVINPAHHCRDSKQYSTKPGRRSVPSNLSTPKTADTLTSGLRRQISPVSAVANVTHKR